MSKLSIARLGDGSRGDCDDVTADGDGDELTEIVVDTCEEMAAFAEEMKAARAELTASLRDLKSDWRAARADAEPTDAND